MTERAGEMAGEAAGEAAGEMAGETELDRALNALKPVATPADTSPVVTPGIDPRMAWDTIIDRKSDDAPPEPPTTKPPALSFQFDLGGAMTGSRVEPSPVTTMGAVDVPPLEMRRPGGSAQPTTPGAPAQTVSFAPITVPPLETRRPAEPPAAPSEPSHIVPAPTVPAPTVSAPTVPAPIVPAPFVLAPETISTPSADAVVAPPLDVRRPAQSGPQPAPSEPATPVTTPLERRPTPDSRGQEPPRRTVFDDEASGAARAALHRVPVGSSIAEAAGMKLPSLPTTVTATPSSVPFEPTVTTAPSVSDVRAYRTAQQRTAKRNGQGRFIRRTMMVVVLLGAVIGAALMFGRGYLFPTEWDPALTPLVDDIQVARGADFVEPIDLVVQPEAEYAATFAALFVPGGWEEQLPAWRALGIASGDPTTESVAASLAAARPALFDPGSESIIQLADADPDDLEAALRVALEHGFDFQRGNASNAPADGSPRETSDGSPGAVGFLGVSDHQVLVDRSLALALADGSAPVPTENPALPAAADVPLPVAYELAAIARIGPAVADASADAGVILAADGDYPASVYSVFVPPGPVAPLGAVLADGEALATPPLALSSDDWRLVLGARVSPGVVDAVVPAITANSYGTFQRAGVACFAAVFQFGEAASAQGGIDGLRAWVAALPVASGVVVTPIDFTTLQVVGCDPGTADPIAIDARWADTVIDGQLARL